MYTEIQNKLFSAADKKYAEFQAKLTPTVDKNSIIGVRVPKIRLIAKELVKENNYIDFVKSLPHSYYDENMLHSAILSNIKDFDLSVNLLNEFLPYVDNWAVCDIIRPKSFDKNIDNALTLIIKWINSKHTYTCRFGIQMLMTFYLDGNFKKEYLKYPLKVKSNEYYVNMMIAWFFATALAKQWDSTVYIIENKLLDTWTHNKTIQKSVESLRITEEQKMYLKGF